MSDGGPAVQPTNWQAAFHKLEAAYGVVTARLDQLDGRVDALENRLGTALPATMRVTELIMKVEP